LYYTIAVGVIALVSCGITFFFPYKKKSKKHVGSASTADDEFFYEAKEKSFKQKLVVETMETRLISAEFPTGNIENVG